MSIKAVVAGATGYVGGELLRLIAAHPEFDFCAAISGSRHGRPIADTFPHLRPAYGELQFSTLQDWGASLGDGDGVAVFSAAPHAASAELVEKLLADASPAAAEVHVVDASADFRYSDADEFASVYGTAHQAPSLLSDFSCAVPEHTAGISTPHVGHPGCFATAMLLAAVPLYRSAVVKNPVFVAATTGSTGSGRTPQPGTHHPERHGNMYAYKPLAHRHVPEVRNLIRNASGADADIMFVPHSGAYARGIYATLQGSLQRGVSHQQVVDAFEASYGNSRFVEIVSGTPKLKNVVASNYAHIGIETAGDSVAVMCAIDNLVKGAAGGAVQWMNRLWSLPEDTGLTTTAPAWT